MLVDLHTHTDASDGSMAPEQLVEAALAAGLQTLAITDHDTFGGYERAEAAARRAGLRLISGIELNTRHGGRAVHLLAYFAARRPGPAFRTWLDGLVAARRERNRRLIAKLQTMGVEITLAEVEALGRTMTGRPHFARRLVEKGYARNREAAFAEYLGETGRAFVERDAPSLEEAIRLVAEAGGLASLAHPVRLGTAIEAGLLADARAAGLPAIEAYHSDQDARVTAHYLALAREHGLAVTGGSDFHGTYKPGWRLGYAANGTIPVPESVLDALPAP
jgi:hypothetical protein